MNIFPLTLGFLTLLCCVTAHSRVTEFNIVAVEPFAEGARFGDAGAYERVRGTYKGELDPAAVRNKVIVNLDKAPRNAAGRVEYEADFFMLRPAEAARGNGKLIYDVTNRGRKYIHWRLMDARTKSVAQANDPRTLEDAGNGLLFRMGYTFVWSGWDPDAPRANNGMGMKPVIATNNGAPIVRVIRDELVNGTRSPQRETFRLTHNAATLDQTQAKLTVRRREVDPRVEIPASGWAWVNDREIRLLPEGTKPAIGSIYEFHYPAKDPRVLGIGFAAVRDLVSFDLMPENAFPFSTARMTDPVTGKTDGLMRNDGFDPLWMETNTSTEYWQKGASLLVTDPLSTKDVTLPAHARAYLIAGTQHGGQAWMTSTLGNCVNPRNPHSPTPALRALLVALSEWVDGKTPPPSQTPRLADNTLVTVNQLAFPAIPGVAVARKVSEFGVLTDWIKPAMDMSKPYRPLITNVDADGNEIAGIRLPEVAVPLGTYTGWNLYKAPFVEGELCDRDGTYIPFVASREARMSRNDPRASLEERYGTHAAYVARLTDAAQKLVAQRLLLKEDAERLAERARGEAIAKQFVR